MRLGGGQRAWDGLLTVGLTTAALALGAPAAAEPAEGAPPPVSARPPAAPPAAASAPVVSALGRLEPKDGVIRVSGPSGPAVVIAELRVEEGDRVEEDAVIAVLDTVSLRRAEVARLEAELADARAKLARQAKLHSSDVVSAAKREDYELRVRVATAELRRARADLALAFVRAPVSGRVLEVHAHEGERVGPDGIVELGRTDAMYAIAEVYETDVGKVRVGQRATVESPALPRVLHGTVERIGLKVGRLEMVDSDPQSRVDARVVEVEVKLDESELAEKLTNLQVEVLIGP